MKTNSNAKVAPLLAPSVFLVLLGLVLPLFLLLRFSFNAYEPGQFMVSALTTSNYKNILTDSYYIATLRTTVLMATGVTAFCLVIGFPVANFIRKVDGKYKSLYIIALFLPLFVGNAVRAAGWMVAFGRNGVIDSLIRSFGFYDSHFDIMYSWLAVFFGMAAVNLPFVVLTLNSVLEGLDPKIEEAAVSLGGTPLQTWRHVTLPLAKPGILAASFISFVLAMNAYATPVLLGGPDFQMMAPVIANQILGQYNWPVGGALSFLLITVTIIITVMLYFIGGYKKDT